MKDQIAIKVPASFDFRSTVESHGWCELAPFSLNGGVLRYVFADEGGAVGGSIRSVGGKVKVAFDRPTERADEFAASVRHILRLDEDFGEFYEAIAFDPRLAWIPERKAGRLLRSPTVWEDLVKSLCTTNCSWALTKIMVRNLVEKKAARSTSAELSSSHGVENPPANAGGSAFPTAAVLAGEDERFFREEIRAGYRSPYFVELAERVASGELDPEAWLTSDLPTAELKKEMKRVKGVGDYAAENLLKLVGRYDGLALDSWLRSQFYKHHNGGEKCEDSKIRSHYERFGRWQGLVIWSDMTEKWMTKRDADGAA